MEPKFICILIKKYKIIDYLTNLITSIGSQAYNPACRMSHVYLALKNIYTIYIYIQYSFKTLGTRYILASSLFGPKVFKLHCMYVVFQLQPYAYYTLLLRSFSGCGQKFFLAFFDNIKCLNILSFTLNYFPHLYVRYAWLN